MENFALRMRARHGDELLRSVEPHGFVPQGTEVDEIPARVRSQDQGSNKAGRPLSRRGTPRSFG